MTDTEPLASGTGLTGFAQMAMFSDKTSDRMRKLLGAYVVATTGWRIGKHWYDRGRTNAIHTVSVSANDDIYPDVHVWLLEQIPGHKRRSLSAQSNRQVTGDPVAVDGSGRSDGALRLHYDGSRSQKVNLDGCTVTVSLERPDLSNMTEFSRDRFVDRLVFTSTSVEGRDAVVAFLRSVVANRTKRAPRFFALSRWVDWRHLSDVPMRPLRTVVLQGTQAEDLSDDLARFLGEEADYARVGVPWHRGYLFSGPPGTGKSSIAGALAAHFGLDVYFLALGSVKDDSTLTALLADVLPRSMLVLEDIDIVHSSRSRTDDTPGVTLAGLLNALDGMLTPHGLITCLTTNHAEVLDSALTRPGRVDLALEFGYLDADQLRRLLVSFTGGMPKLPPLTAQVTPAEVVDVLKRHMGAPADATKELAELVVKR